VSLAKVTPSVTQAEPAIPLTAAMITWKLFWAPEGKFIATVQARTERAARRKAPMPYRKYLGEIYAISEDRLGKVQS